LMSHEHATKLRISYKKPPLITVWLEVRSLVFSEPMEQHYWSGPLDMNGKNEWHDDARKNALKIIGLLALEKMKQSSPSLSKSLPENNGILLVNVAFGIDGKVVNFFAQSHNPHPKNKSGNVEDAVSFMTAFVYATMEHDITINPRL